MANAHPCITQELMDFIATQRMFFVATAPMAKDGHINLSPKGLDTFQILSSNQVAYLDLTGSGNETAAHVLENGRITFMFCAFEGTPKILRLYGTAQAIQPATEHWNLLSPLFGSFPGARQIFLADINRVQTSCGFGVPFFEFQGNRDLLPKWATKKGDDGLAEYRQKKNSRSIDGLRTPIAP